MGQDSDAASFVLATKELLRHRDFDLNDIAGANREIAPIRLCISSGNRGVGARGKNMRWQRANGLFDDLTGQGLD
jgi:hypothetical protein